MSPVPHGLSLQSQDCSKNATAKLRRRAALAGAGIGPNPDTDSPITNSQAPRACGLRACWSRGNSGSCLSLCFLSSVICSTAWPSF